MIRHLDSATALQVMRLARALGRDPLDILEDDPARVYAQITLMARAHEEWARQVNDIVNEMAREGQGGMCSAHLLLPVLENLW